MRIVFLGTASSIPMAERSLPSLAIVRGGELLLFDVGEGAQRSMIHANLSPNRVSKVFLTHLHGDHCVGLLGLMQTLSLMARRKPLHIYGPRGTLGFIKDSIRHLKFHLTYPLYIHMVREGVVVREREYLVRAARAEHSIPTYAYRLDEYERPGVFHPERACELGVPRGVLWSKLQRGECVEVGGRVVKPEDVLGPKRRGRSVGVSGDTRPTAKLTRFFQGVDVLVFDSTYGDDHADKAAENLHSTAREAASLARDAGVKLLILTHFSARYSDVGVLVAQASEVHGNVVAAYDGLGIDVPYPD